MSNRIYTAPPGTGHAVRGKTLPDILYDTCARVERPRAFNQPAGDGWQPLSMDGFRQAAEETALGLLDAGLSRGECVGFFMESDVHFCVADMGCLIAGLVDVPIYLTHTEDAIRYVLQHAGCRALFVADSDRFEQVAGVLAEVQAIDLVILATGDAGALPDVGRPLQVVTHDDLRRRGRSQLEARPDAIDTLKAQIKPDDLATIIYTSGTTGLPKGVMLTHENISSNALTAFTGMTGFTTEEVAVSFLPLTHIFARTLHYGLMAYGTEVYFTSPNDLGAALPKVRPTVFATVPRVLEKVYARILEKAADLTGVKKVLLNWALDLARRYELGDAPSGLYALQLKLADRLVFTKWRDALGGRVRFVIAGGAALNAELANVFAAAGVNVLQGYGLTETSPVIAFNRPERNRAGTVGEPLCGVEVRIAENGEILTRGPHVMQGYYQDEEKTREVLDADGWFHTGDVGEFTADGFLRITDRIKDLFKLSTGKYVVPQPLENQLTKEPLVEQAVVVGDGEKFCAALIFPDHDALGAFARAEHIEGESVEAWCRHPSVVAAYQRLVDQANEGVDHWSTIKRFRLVPEHLSPENGLLTPTLKVKRSLVRERFQGEIDALYREYASSPPRASAH